MVASCNHCNSRSPGVGYGFPPGLYRFKPEKVHFRTDRSISKQMRWFVGSRLHRQ